MPQPTTPITAVTHPDPYPYYAALIARAPLYWDNSLGLWVATGADAITALLHSPACRVRSPTEPVPTALLGTPAADIFRHLIRMNDGPGHCPLKEAVAATLGAFDVAHVTALSERWARLLIAQLHPQDDPSQLPAFAFQMTATIVGRLLGVPRDVLPQTVQWVSDLVSCFAPLSTPE